MEEYDIYLAGAIRVDTFNNILDIDMVWRNKLKNDYPNIKFFDPVTLEKEERFLGDQLNKELIYKRDIYGLKNSKCALFNFLPKGDHPLIGSLFEIGYLSCMRTKCYIVTNWKEFINNPMMFGQDIFDTVDDAMKQIIKDFNIK